jgi:CubicO group peptidase (beta-lactamase class C family)
MRDTGFSVTDRKRLATPYFNSRPLPQRMSDPQEVMIEDKVMLTFAPTRAFNPASFPSGGAGMVGTAGDFLKFLETLRTGGAPVLKPATVKAMMTNQVGDMTTLSGPGWGFGYGAAVLTDATAAASPLPPGSWSWSGIYGTSWFLDPVSGFSVVAFTNTAPEGDFGPFAMQVRAAVYGASQ